MERKTDRAIRNMEGLLAATQAYRDNRVMQKLSREQVIYIIGTMTDLQKLLLRQQIEGWAFIGLFWGFILGISCVGLGFLIYRTL